MTHESRDVLDPYEPYSYPRRGFKEWGGFVEIVAKKDWKLKARKPVRHKKIKGLIERLTVPLGVETDLSTAFLETANFGPWNLLIVDKSPLGMEVESPKQEIIAFPTLRGILAWSPNLKWCEVDHGAIPFLMNGADCMAAGIHRACDTIEEGDLIWIRDQSHGKPLAIGWATMGSNEMVESTKGKAVKMLHHIGDELWELEL
ncbi:MAG: RNA-binding protein [Euryarchaeota archaeon]|nr:RNA-binding protein [Euryarchaeota archaeon]